MRVIVEIQRGARAGVCLKFEGKTKITVGRDPASDVALDPNFDSLASTRHAEIRIGSDKSAWWVDLGSSNGSFINGSRVTNCVLSHGTQVELGPSGPLLQISFEAVGAQPGPGASPRPVYAPAPAPVAPPAAQGFQPAPAQAIPPVQSFQPPPAQAAAPSQAPVQPPAPLAPLPASQPPAPSTPAQAPAAAASSPASPAGQGPARQQVGAETMAQIVEQAVEQRLAREQKKTPRSTQFLRSFVDKEIRQQNRGLFWITLILGILLISTIAFFVVFFIRQQGKEKDHKKAQQQISRMTDDAKKREAQFKKEIDRLKQLNRKVMAMAQDKGPRISRMNSQALYLLAYGRLNQPRYAVCTAFAIEKRVLATNAHCVVAVRGQLSRGAYFYVIQNENPAFRAAVIEMKQHPRYVHGSRLMTQDLGLLKVDRDLPGTVLLASTQELKEVKPGSMMFSFGFPGRLADVRKPVATLVHGVIGRLTRFDSSLGSFGQNQLVQHSALTMGGASGSPLFNSEGKVIGVHAGSYAESTTETVFDPRVGSARKVTTARRSGYKFGIRIDVLSTIRTAFGWEKVRSRGTLRLVTVIPPDLKNVDCKKLGRKVTICTKDAAVGNRMYSQCRSSKLVPSPVSIRVLRFSKCMLMVKGCSKSGIKACVALLKG